MIKNKYFSFFKDKTTFPEPVWVLFYGDYMHLSKSLIELLKEVIFEYKNDKHLAM
jgi:hypothetical protein